MSGMGVVAPHDPALEQEICATVLKKPEEYERIASRVDAGAFFVPRFRAIWDAFGECGKQGVKPDVMMVYAQLLAKGQDAMVGGPAGLAEMSDTLGMASQVQHLLDRLLELQRRRVTLDVARKLSAAAGDLSKPLHETTTTLGKELAEALVDRSRSDQQEPSGFIQEWIDRLERLAAVQSHVLKTPFYGLNGLASGFFPGEVIVLAARPGAGKTAFALNLVEYSLKKKRKVGVFSLEMSKFSLLDRMAASGRLVGSDRVMDAQRFRDGKFEDSDWTHLYEFADIISRDVALRVWDRASARPSEIRAQAAAWKQDMGGLDLLVVDYLQLTSPDSRGSSREREVGEVSRSMKTLALELDVPVLLLSQLSREAERSKKPLLSHLRESGSIEQDADMVIFLSPKRDDETDEGYEVEADVAKGRGNRTGSFRLYYRRKHLQFANLDTDHQ